MLGEGTGVPCFREQQLSRWPRQRAQASGGGQSAGEPAGHTGTSTSIGLTARASGVKVTGLYVSF